eukprot:jgi/Bigna1/147140/aug1.130_g21848
MDEEEDDYEEYSNMKEEGKYWNVDADGTFNGIMPNIPRADAGTVFGADACRDFLQLVGCHLLVRSHEYKEEGFEVSHGGKCLTVIVL